MIIPCPFETKKCFKKRTGTNHTLLQNEQFLRYFVKGDHKKTPHSADSWSDSGSPSVICLPEQTYSVNEATFSIERPRGICG